MSGMEAGRIVDVGIPAYRVRLAKRVRLRASSVVPSKDACICTTPMSTATISPQRISRRLSLLEQHERDREHRFERLSERFCDI